MQRFFFSDQLVRSRSDAALTGRQRKSDGSRDIARSPLRAGRLRASGGLLAIILALLLTPGRTLLYVERAVVVGVDLVKALAINRVAFRFGHRSQLIVIGLAPLDAGLFGCGQARGRQLLRQPRLALCEITQPEIAVLLEGNRFARGRVALPQVALPRVVRRPANATTPP